MKISALAATGVVALVAGSLNATPGVVYNDSASDISGGINAAGGTANILSCEVSHTATDIQFSLTVNGSVNNTDWAKFMIGISSPGSALKTTSGNGWGRPINFASNGGMNYWVGSWVDGGGGGQLWNNTAGGWNGPASASIALSGNNVTLTVSRAAIGMSGDGTFLFDVYTSGGGGGDGAIDALSTNAVSMANWGDSFTTTNALSYAIPAPGAVALVGLAGLVARRRKA
ncbi:MAG: hypothetical protein ACOYMI_08970 [Phycisphaerales bacterium]